MTRVGRIAGAALLATVVASSPAPAATLQQAAICNTPPCTREELQRYEAKLIRRLQQANRLSFEARHRGETETADRLHRVFRRSFDRRMAVVEAIQSTSD